MAGALEGVRILDLTWGVAGPIGVLLLAEQGADVIKVEPPDGGPFRKTTGSYVWNRSRRSVTINLQDAEGVELFLKLLETADVLVECFRPGVMEKLGLGYAVLEPRFPRLIYCSVPGYPSNSRHAGRPGYDALVQARSGEQYEQPGHRPGPVFLHTPQPSMATMYLVSIGIVTALRARELMGEGQHVETSLYQGVLGYTTQIWQYSEKSDPQSRSMMQKAYPLTIHQASIYECDDGEWIHAAATSGMTPKKSPQEILGLPPGPSLREMATISPEERARRAEETRAAYKKRKRDELVEQFHENLLGAEAIIPPEEMYSNPQLIANGMVVEVDDPELGPTTQIGIPFTLTRTPGEVKGPQPLLGQHNSEVFGELGVTDAQLEDLAAKGAI